MRAQESESNVVPLERPETDPEPELTERQLVERLLALLTAREAMDEQRADALRQVEEIDERLRASEEEIVSIKAHAGCERARQARQELAPYACGDLARWLVAEPDPADAGAHEKRGVVDSPGPVCGAGPHEGERPGGDPQRFAALCSQGRPQTTAEEQAQRQTAHLRVRPTEVDGVEQLQPTHGRAETTTSKRITKEERRIWRLLYPEATSLQRPRTRADCQGGVRPCPWVGCRYHLYLDVSTHGGIKVNFPWLEPWDLPFTCALDLADAGSYGRGMTLESTGAAMNVTRERCRQIEDVALEKANAKLRELLPGLEASDLAESRLTENLGAAAAMARDVTQTRGLGGRMGTAPEPGSPDEVATSEDGLTPTHAQFHGSRVRVETSCLPPGD